MNQKKLKKYQNILTIKKSTTVLVLTALKLESGYSIEKMLKKDRRENYVLLASRQPKKVEILNLIIQEFAKIIMIKIRPLRIQKWMILQKILVVNLLYFKVKEIKMYLLSISILRASFPLLRKNVKTLQFNRLSRISTGEF